MRNFNLRAALEEHRVADEAENILIHDHEMATGDFSEANEPLDVATAAAATREAVLNAPTEEAALECFKLFMRMHPNIDSRASLESATTKVEMVASLEGIMRDISSKLRNLGNSFARRTMQLSTVLENKIAILNQIAGKHNKLLRGNRIDDTLVFHLSSDLASRFFMAGVNKSVLDIFNIDKKSCEWMLIEYPKLVRNHDAANLKAIGQMVRSNSSGDIIKKLKAAPTPIASIPANLRKGQGFMQGGMLVCSQGDFEQWDRGYYLAKLEMNYSKGGKTQQTEIKVTQKDVERYVNACGELIDVMTDNLTQYRRFIESSNTAWLQIQNVLANTEDMDDAIERFGVIKTMIGNSYRGTRSNYHVLNHAYRSAMAMSKLIDKMLA